MKQAIKAFLLSLILAACGAPLEHEDDSFELSESVELGQLEEEIIYLDSATKQWGTQTGSDRRSCNKTSTGQVCTLAKFKAIEIARNPSAWTDTEDDQLSLVVFELNSDYGSAGWTFTFVDSANPPAANVVRLLVSRDTTGGGNNGTDIKNYRTINFHSPVSMTEGQHPGLATPVGNYQHHGSCSTSLFITRINAKGANTNEDLRLLDHTLGNAAVVCMGLGTQSSGSYAFRRSVINLTGFAPAATGGDSCRASVSEFNDLADISRQTASSCAD
jgi:hypothetical protein